MSSDQLNSTIFRASLIVMMILGIPVIGILVYLNLQQADQKPVGPEAAITEPAITEPAPIQTVPSL